MSLIHVTHEPTSLVQVDGQCAAIEAWAEQCESVPELRDAGNKLAAIDEYLTRTSTEGRSRVAAAMRRIEVRIGDLLGPAVNPAGKSIPHEESIPPNRRHEFRQMAAHPEIVEDEIARSTDEAPASRRKVIGAIKQQTKPQRSPLADTAERAGWQFRQAVERLEKITEDDRFSTNKEQVAAHWYGHLLYAIEVCQDLVHQLNHGE